MELVRGLYRFSLSGSVASLIGSANKLMTQYGDKYLARISQSFYECPCLCASLKVSTASSLSHRNQWGRSCFFTYQLILISQTECGVFLFRLTMYKDFAS
jgi:hypothetical protein